MSYQVIARRFRPQQFSDVMGQEHVTRVLEGAIRSERVAHAYLFCGPRGVGKTSTARILARALNCQQGDGPTPEPCNECQVCQEITVGTSLDTIEIDGASNRGIDDVRELRESARYAPVGGRYKLYIIDEVHMLTNEAFNALLKTLEEPPSHVVFIFATTEAQKVPPTILSRCQRFDFRRLGVAEIAGQLERIVTAEKYKVDAGALVVMARRGQGSMRDAESLLEQVLVGIDRRKKVTREIVERLLGLPPTETFLEISDALRRQDAAGALTCLESSLGGGGHLDELATGLVEHLRNLLLLKVSDSLAESTGLGEDVVEQCQAQIADWSKGDLARMLELAAQAVEQMRRSDFPQLHLEMALVQMAELPSTSDLQRLVDALESGGDGGGGGSREVAPPASPARAKGGSRSRTSAPRARDVAPAAGVLPPPPADDAAPFTPEVQPPSAPLASSIAGAAPTAALGGRWGQVLDALKHRKTYLASLMAEAADPRLEDGVLSVTLATASAFHREQLLADDNKQIVGEVLRGVLGAPTRFRVRESSATAPTAPAAAPPAARRVPLEFTGEVESMVTRFDGVILPDA